MFGKKQMTTLNKALQQKTLRTAEGFFVTEPRKLRGEYLYY